MSMATEHDLEDIRRLIEQRQVEAETAAEEAAAAAYEYVRPLGSAATSYIHQVQNVDGRFLLGFKEVDRLTRGHGPGELTYVTGRAHSGKTQVILNAVNQNSDKHVLMFTPDESPEAVLAKLVAIRYSLGSDSLEDRIKRGDTEALKLVKRTASHDFQRLIVVGQTLSLKQMGQALFEAEDYWQETTDCVIYDFLELLPGDGGYEGVVGKSQALKRWTNTANVPVICLHQGKRGDRGVAAGMDGMKYGGDTEAVMVLEVFRKKDNAALPQYDRYGHENTVTVNVAKNKRPPMRLGEVDLFLDPDTGLIRSLSESDLIRAGLPTQDAMAVIRATRRD